MTRKAEVTLVYTYHDMGSNCSLPEKALVLIDNFEQFSKHCLMNELKVRS
jgi:hypothetical protein